MRNFDERMAEIHRRGEELKRKRSIRNKILAVCVPVVLCVGLCPLLLQEMKAAPTEMPVGLQQELYSETMAAMGQEITVQRIHVEGLRWSATHTEPAVLAEISRILEHVENRTQTSSQTPDIVGAIGTEDDPKYTGAGNVTREDMGYSVTVETAEGSKTYYLLGSMLRDLQSGEAYSLTEAELASLKDALGIPLY